MQHRGEPNSVIAQLLLVEDEAIIAMDKRQILADLGYGCSAVHSGEKAVQEVLRNPEKYDLVLMDIDLGVGLDGVEAAQAILDHVDLPIVFMSSHTEAEIIQRTEEVTSYGYLVKSSDRLVLDASIKMALKLFRANRETERERDNLTSLFEGSPVGKLVIDRDYTVVRVNEAARQITGKGLEGLVKPRCGDFLGCVNRHRPPYRCGESVECPACVAFSQIKRTLTERVSSGTREAPFTVDAPEKGPGGTKDIWLRFSTSPITLGGEEAVVLAITDITEERSASKLRQQLAKLSESPNTLVVITDAERRVTWANEAFEKLTGFTLRELIGENPGELLQGPDPDRALKEEMSRAFDQGLPFDTEVLNYRKDGTPYWISMDVQPLADEEGGLEGFISTQRDITAEKNLLEKLRRRDDRLWSLLDRIEASVVVLDASDRAIYANTAFLRITGFSQDELPGLEGDRIFELLHPEDRPAVRKRVSDAVARGLSEVSISYRARVASTAEAHGGYEERQDLMRFFYSGAAGALEQTWIVGRTGAGPKSSDLPTSTGRRSSG